MTGTATATRTSNARHGEPHDRNTPRFRPDVEGLRAIAVLLVLAYHAGVPAFSGGFVGVDVFFVISGYLITGLLIREITTTGRLSLRRFYARRVRRLLPATAVVLVATAVLTVLFLPPLRWAQVTLDLASSSLYVINWRLAADSVNYLATENAPSPVQHFWSLAVEEQFYLVWPILLLALVWWHRRSGWSLQRTMLVGLVVIAVPSLLYSIHLTGTIPAQAYFVSTTRAWELAIGAILAAVAPRLVQLPRAVCEPLAWAGLVAIAAAALTFDSATPFPGEAALLPTLGAAAVIGAGIRRSRTTAAATLGIGPMRWLGALSYSLYLWHWPLLVAATAVWGELSVTRGVLVAAASVVPAWLTYRLIERPIHHAPRLVAQPGHALGVGAVATAVGLVAALAPIALTPKFDVVEDAPGAAVLGANPATDPDGRPTDRIPAMTPNPLDARRDMPDMYADGCLQSLTGSELISCAYGDPSADRVLALVGDSHAAQWQPAFDIFGQRAGWRIETHTKASCGLFSVDVSTLEGQPYASCTEWRDALIERLTGRNRPDVVVVSGSNNYHVMVDGEPVAHDEKKRRFAAGLAASWQQVIDAGARLIVLRNTPWLGIDVPECLSEYPSRPTQCAWSRRAALENAGDHQLVAAKQVAGVSLIDLNEAICPAKECAPVIGNVLVWRDAHHLTATYVRTLAPRLEADIVPFLNGL